MTRHKHADCIIAWANGEEIEFREPGLTTWVLLTTLTPRWDASWEYRIKPQDIRVSTRLKLNGAGDHVFGQHPMFAASNCVCVFDGETRELLRVEIIK